MFLEQSEMELFTSAPTPLSSPLSAWWEDVFCRLTLPLNFRIVFLLVDFARKMNRRLRYTLCRYRTYIFVLFIPVWKRYQYVFARKGNFSCVFFYICLVVMAFPCHCAIFQNCNTFFTAHEFRNQRRMYGQHPFRQTYFDTRCTCRLPRGISVSRFVLKCLIRAAIKLWCDTAFVCLRIHAFAVTLNVENRIGIRGQQAPRQACFDPRGACRFAGRWIARESRRLGSRAIWHRRRLVSRCFITQGLPWWEMNNLCNIRLICLLIETQAFWKSSIVFCTPCWARLQWYRASWQCVSVFPHHEAREERPELVLLR